MSSYYVELVRRGPGDAVQDLGVSAEAYLDRMLEKKAGMMSKLEGFNYLELTPVQRLFITSYWCPVCKLLPLYALNLVHHNKVRCGKCGNVISFPGKGKYGKLRKKVAFSIWHELGDGKDVPQ